MGYTGCGYDGRVLWNPSRARNFVKAIGKKPTRFLENIAVLANVANMQPDQFIKEMNPIVFIEKYYKGQINPYYILDRLDYEFLSYRLTESNSAV